MMCKVCFLCRHAVSLVLCMWAPLCSSTVAWVSPPLPPVLQAQPDFRAQDQDRPQEVGFTDHQLNPQVLIIFLDLVPRCPLFHPPVVSWIAPDTTALPNTSGPENANSHSAHLEILELLGNVLSTPVLLKPPRMGAQL